MQWMKVFVSIITTVCFLTPLYVKVKHCRYRPNWPKGWIEVQLYPFMTSAQEGVGGQHHAPAALPPGKTRYPLYIRLGGPQVWSGLEGGWSVPRPGCFTPGKDPVPIVHKSGWAPGVVWPRGWVVSTTPRPLYPRERPGTHCT